MSIGQQIDPNDTLWIYHKVESPYPEIYICYNKWIDQEWLILIVAYRKSEKKSNSSF